MQLPVCGWTKGFCLFQRTSLRTPSNKTFWGGVTLRCLIHTEGWEDSGSTREEESGFWARMGVGILAKAREGAGMWGEKPKEGSSVSQHVQLMSTSRPLHELSLECPLSQICKLAPHFLQGFCKGHVICEAFLDPLSPNVKCSPPTIPRGVSLRVLLGIFNTCMRF